MQNSRLFKNFHDVPMDKILLFHNRAILKVKFFKGTEIMKNKNIVNHVLIAEIKKKVSPVYCESWLGGMKMKKRKNNNISDESDHYVEESDIHSMQMKNKIIH